MRASVIMSVYNTKEEYLQEAIDSILNQTETDFEFIIVDDCCDEDTKRVLSSYTDNRIKLIVNKENKGLTYNLNVALSIATGDYIVRMDADDIAYNTRIEKMTAYMNENPNVNVLGSYMDCGNIIRKYHGNIPWEIRKAMLLFDNVGLGHPSVIFRKSFLDKYDLCYDVEIKKSQDYEMWTRCIEYSNLNVYPECLMKYRIHDEQISTKQASNQNEYMRTVKIRQLSKFKPYLTDDEINEFVEGDRNSKLSLKDYKKICKKIIVANDKYNLVDNDILKFVLRQKYGVYLNFHNLFLYRIEKYLYVPFNKRINKYTEIIKGEDDNYSYQPI
ncbi:MAG: glycosyltransferase family 2 protein [Lachnospiraceae bacterium]|nr:glycosyltransferase family 2 protein [Lachnospiraceae bacterium]